MQERPQFRMELLRAGQATAVIALEGEVDIHTSSQFKEALLVAIDEGAITIIVDLARVTFIDSTALGVLVSVARRKQLKNGRLDIVCSDESIRRIFESTGLDRVFALYSTRQEALSDAISG